MSGRRSPAWMAAALVTMSCATLLCMRNGEATEPASNLAEPVEYLRDVKPILAERCFACHGALKQESGLRLDTAELARKGGDSGAAIMPGDARASLLVERVTDREEATRMPPEGPPLTAAQMETLQRWIAQGAPAPADEQPQADPADHWAFQVPVRPALPSIDGSGMANGDGPGATASHAIDLFIGAEHQRQGLTAGPAAERSLLLRRVYLDLIGLPPTRGELYEFLADESPDAYERVVQRLLDSPPYGERWGRHWMDIWRYADWHGRRMVPDVWNSAPQVWRWRDWIVRSLNEDKGYDRMLQEMLAADEIAPEDDQAAVATGYLVRNWYALNPNDWMRSNVEHTAKAMLGLTFNCAHCHDHKYDPITQEDYFRFRAFFEPIGVRQDRVAGEPDPGPFQEYSYSVLRKIVRLGAVRIYDKSPEAATWFYAGGDERNRLSERGSIAPGLPGIFGSDAIQIREVQLPAVAWYPGLRAGIQETELDAARESIAAADAELTRIVAEHADMSSVLRDLAVAEAEFAEFEFKFTKAGQPGALAGRQSLVLDATAGRRILNNSLTGLGSLPEGSTLSFQLRLLSDTHFNIQLAKDVVQGLTAGYVAFDGGRIVSYQPGTFTELEAGRYDFSAGQNHFLVTLKFQLSEDQALLTVRDHAGGEPLVADLPVAINGWNPVGDPVKAITFDARSGSKVVIDDIVLRGVAAEGEATGNAPSTGKRLWHADFELPAYRDGQDVVGIDGWAASTFCAAPATSVVSSTACNEALIEFVERVRRARRAVDVRQLKRQGALAARQAAEARLASVEGRIAADRLKFRQTKTAGALGPEESARDSDEARVAKLAAAAVRAELDAAVQSAKTELIVQDQQLAAAETRPADDPKRAEEIEAAMKRLAAVRDKLAQAQAAAAQPPATYTAFSLTYSERSTGRRRALAEWLTSRSNPLAARVAVNHIWLRHFHSPLVATVNDFGHSGARPTHPELLDWLAVEFMESGWSMKHLHRLIVTSQTYRRSSAAAGERENSLDVDNRWLWRMNTGRMEAEVVRDSLLYGADRLDLTRGGQELENSEALTTRRRSLYYSCQPEGDGKSPFGALFDAAEAIECYRRTRSIVPQQALALTNSELVHELSGALAAAVWTEVSAIGTERETAFVDAAFERVLSRLPNPAERDACLTFLDEQRSGMEAGAGAARESLVRVLLNHNDFITIR